MPAVERVRRILAYGIAASMLSGCGGSLPSAGLKALPQARAETGQRLAPASSYRVVTSFGRPGKGAHPFGSLIDVDGTLYGTTYAGGAKNEGTVFSITAAGQETVLHSFAGGFDGANPQAGLLAVKGMLYGTTSAGGAHGDGTVFRITTRSTGTVEKVLYSFKGGSDGANPFAALIDVRGMFYGTTLHGGQSDYGTVFRITAYGTERVLHRFSGLLDGAWPYASLTGVRGTMYGTTDSGGMGCGSYDCGTVFSITPGGQEQVLYRFNGLDGAYATTSLLNVNGVLFGTTLGGGPNGFGTVYSITTSGEENAIYDFAGGTDGIYPSALVSVRGKLFGTTSAGGVNNDGTIFSVTALGDENVLYSFGTGSHDGIEPFAGLLDVDGALYGTTGYGGGGRLCVLNHREGCGTVFAFTPSR